MSNQIFKTTNIKGCALWKCVNDVPVNPQVPQAEGVTITIPEISFPTVDVNIMGTLSVPDHNRIDNLSGQSREPAFADDGRRRLRELENHIRDWQHQYRHRP